MSFFPRELAEPAAAGGPAIEWEEVDCPLCDSRSWSPVIEAPDNRPGSEGLWFAVVRCHDCGLCFTNPRPSPRSILRFYPTISGPRRPLGQAARLTVRGGPIRRWLRRQPERKVLPWHGEGRLLDFGCGYGSFLERMHRQGWRVTGLDISRPAIQRIRQEFGLPALLGTLPHPDLKPASFDVITMWHSLEHVHDPREVLRQAYFLLAPGGKLLVAAPNIDSLPFRWFGQYWYGLDLPRHLTHFTPDTLRAMLTTAGFRVDRIRMIRQTGWLRSSARLSRAHGQRPTWSRLLKAKPASRLTAWFTCLARRADCLMATAERGD
jgi:2-polyprenyl-3-methyl-5-hydroxy-6-metoxy-1,4-benzoquinol methylase